MDIAALQAFLAVAETGSFSRAAERIFLTQPAVSKRIAALETSLGTRLFDRIGRTIQITPAGQALLTRSHAILRELDDVRRSITNLAGGHQRRTIARHQPSHRAASAPRATQAIPRNLPRRASRSALHGFGKGLPRGGPGRD